MPGLLVIRTNVQAPAEDEFNEWYSNIHLPEIVKVPGFLRGRRYRLANPLATFSASPGEQRYLAIYELDRLSVLESEEFKRVRGWKPSLAPYAVDTSRGIYDLMADEIGSGS